MTIQTDTDGQRYIVYKDRYEAKQWDWLWWQTLGCQRVSFNGYDNAYWLI